jgi:hypothetical protein
LRGIEGGIRLLRLWLEDVLVLVYCCN